LKKTAKLEVIITDSEHNNRDMSGLLNPPGRVSEADTYLSFIRKLMREMDIEDKFDNYFIIKPDGDNLEYSHKGHGSSFSMHPPTEKGTELKRVVFKKVRNEFENPRLFWGKRRDKNIYYHTEIYPHNTIMLLEKKFEGAGLSALEELGIEPVLHYDYRQLKMF